MFNLLNVELLGKVKLKFVWRCCSSLDMKLLIRCVCLFLCVREGIGGAGKGGSVHFASASCAFSVVANSP